MPAEGELAALEASPSATSRAFWPTSPVASLDLSRRPEPAMVAQPWHPL